MNQTPNWETPEEIIRAEMEPGETLLWAGRPTQGLVLRSAGVQSFLGGIFFIVFLSFIFGGANRNFAGQLPFFLFAVPILLYNVIQIVTRPLLDMQFRSRMAYGVTSERVLFVAGKFGHRVKSLELDLMVDVKLHSRGNTGSGIIRFGSDANKIEPRQQSPNWIAAPEMNSFELDREAVTVYRLVEQAIRPQPRTRDLTVIVRQVPGNESASWEQPHDAIQPALQPDEILLWASRPRLGFVPNWAGIFGVFGTFVWMFYFHFMFVGGGRQRNEFTILWFIVGIKMISVVFKVFRALGDSRLRSHMAYGITTNRALIVAGSESRRSRSLAFGALAEISLTERNETGGGTILIGPDVPRIDNPAIVAQMGGTPSHMLRFDLAQDARLAYRLLRRTRRPVPETA